MADFGMPNMDGLLKAAQRLQTEMARVQQELAGQSVEGSAGGGMVQVVVNGRLEVLSVKIDPQVVDPKEVPMLQDLVAAAANQAMVKARELAEREMAKVTGGMGGMGMPGMPGLPGF